MLNHREKIVDMRLLNSNLRELRSFTNRRIFPVLKSNAYGHGLLDVLGSLEVLDGETICVATIQEALFVRNVLPKKRVLFWLHSSIDEIAAAAENNIEFSIGSKHHVEQLLMLERKNVAQLKIHIEIDIGMNRGGFKAVDVVKLIDSLDLMRGKSKIQINGFWAQVNSALSDSEINQQVELFFSVFQSLDIPKGDLIDIHLGGTALIPLCHQLPPDTCLRLGLAIYGYSYPSQAALESNQNINLKVAMKVRAKLLFIKEVFVGESVGYGRSGVVTEDGYIGIVGVGYGDGLPRTFPLGYLVQIRDSLYPIIGTSSMDQLTVKLGSKPSCKVGDWVYFSGTDQLSGLGFQRLDPNQTVNEVISRLGARFQNTLIQ